MFMAHSVLPLAEIVDKGPIDKDGTFNNAEKPAETGTLFPCVHRKSVCDQRDNSLIKRR